MNAIQYTNVIATTFAILLLVIMPNSALAEDYNLPDWVKNIALWWGQGNISDDEYVGALEWMIENGIIQTPSIPEVQATTIDKDSLDEIWSAINNLQLQVGSTQSGPSSIDQSMINNLQNQIDSLQAQINSLSTPSNVQTIQGPQGEPGDDGTSCSVTDTADGATITCTDGTSAVIYDGQSTSTGTTQGDQTFSGNIMVKGPGGFNASGEEAIVQLGDRNHFIKSTHGQGVTIGSWRIPEALTIQQQTGNVKLAGDLTCNGCISGEDIADGAVTGKKLASDVFRTIIVFSEERTLSPGTGGSFTAHCPEGSILVGGGGDGTLGANLKDSLPHPNDSNAWFAYGVNTYQGTDVSFKAVAVCLTTQ